MNHATTLAKPTAGEATWLSPLEAFVAWLASFLRTIAGLKRRTIFPPNWKDHWEGLRELEWYRDQILAFSASHVLAGGSLDDRTDFQLIETVPEDYGVCPQTPQAMNRRFIAMAQFRVDPDKYIQRHIRRIARAAGIQLDISNSGCPLRHASHATSPNAPHWRRKENGACSERRCFPPPRKARGRWHARSCAHDGGGSRRLALNVQPRGPPNSLSANANLPRWPRQRGRTHLFRSAPNPGNAKVSPLTGRITYVV